MTGRERLQTRYQWGRAFGVVGLLGMAIGVGVGYVQQVQDSRPLALPGFFVFLFGGLYMYFFSTCGTCHQSLGMLAFDHESFAGWVTSRVRYCPYCGTDLDDAIETSA